MAISLTQEQKTFIVQQNAMFCVASEVVALVRERFGIEIDRNLVNYYNPAYGRDLAEHWREVFRSTREAFLSQINGIPLSHQSYRLNELQKQFDRAKGQPKVNTALLLDIIERAAKEVGGIHTNRRELTGAEGKPLVDTTEFARSLLKELVEKDGLTIEQAVAFVSKDLKVSEDVLISEAEN